MKANLLDFDIEGLAAFCAGLGEKPFRATQLFRWIHQRGESDFSAMTDLAKSLRDKLAVSAHIAAPVLLSQHASVDGTIKWLFDVGGGDAVEAVFIPETDRGTLCVFPRRRVARWAAVFAQPGTRVSAATSALQKLCPSCGLLNIFCANTWANPPG